MISRLKARLLRFFLPSHSDGTPPEEHRRATEKRKRDESMDGDNDDDDDVIVEAWNSRKHFRADDTRLAGPGRPENRRESWLRWAIRKPMQNFFVSQTVRCLSPTGPPEPPRGRPMVPRLQPPHQQTTIWSPERHQRPTSRPASLPSAAEPTSEPGRHVIRNHNSPLYCRTSGAPAHRSPPQSVEMRSSSSPTNSGSAAPIRNGGRYLSSTPYSCMRLQEKREYQLLLRQQCTAPHGQLKPRLRDATTSSIGDANSSAGLAKTQWPPSGPPRSQGVVKADKPRGERTAPASLFVNSYSSAKHLTSPKLKAPWKPSPTTAPASSKPIHLASSLTSDPATAKKSTASTTSSVRTATPDVPELPSSHFFSSTWLQELKDKLTHMDQAAQASIITKEKSLEGRLKKAYSMPSREKPPITEVEAEVTKKEVLPKLTPKMEAAIDRALRPTPPDEVIATGFKLTVTRKDMETLGGLNWLNDEVINFYMNMLMERGRTEPGLPSVYAFNTFFYPKLLSSGYAAIKRWTRRVDIFSHDLILVPVHLGVHWCLAVIDFRHSTIRYYDSMGGQNPKCLEALRKYLQEESRDKKQKELDLSDWTYETVKDIPQQMNGSDCGMFALKYAEYITRDAKITFEQLNMPYFRRRMVYEILTNKLL